MVHGKHTGRFQLFRLPPPKGNPRQQHISKWGYLARTAFTDVITW